MSKIRIALPRVRLTFPHLFTKANFDKNTDSEAKAKYNATFVLSKDNEKHIKAAKQIKASEKSILNGIKLKPGAHPILRCNDEFLESIDDAYMLEKLAYLKGSWSLQASSLYAPILQTSKGVVLDIRKDDDPFYSGCYVNAIIDLTLYKFNNSWKGIVKYLVFVGFSADGERLGFETIDSSVYFPIDEESDESDDFDNDAQKFF